MSKTKTRPKPKSKLNKFQQQAADIFLCNTEDLTKYTFEEIAELIRNESSKVSVWEPFENRNQDDVAEQMEDMADQLAQRFNNRSLIDNCVTLTASVLATKGYGAFYEEHGEDFGGFPGIYREIGNVAEWLTKVESEMNDELGLSGVVWDKHNYIDVCDAIGELFVKRQLVLEDEWKKKIRKIILSK